ncbi:MAG: tRNA (N6-threonylcarbamoyladenosine(37)-N6)-methyltransferase TrmO [bacterium]|jgi:tRNA-Thr(GGU) m(6)t(6)A37 methyltransferase TsaA
MTETYGLIPIGYIRSSVKTRERAPRQGREEGIEVVVDILPEFADAVEGMEELEMLQVICWFHEARRDLLKVRPKRDPNRPLTGVFATRSPVRPNPLTVYAAKLLGVDGLRFRVQGVDAIDGTPVLDIRPHIHRLDD